MEIYDGFGVNTTNSFNTPPNRKGITMELKSVDYDRGLKEGMDLGVSTMCEFRDLLLARIRDHIESENPDLALALINNIID